MAKTERNQTETRIGDDARRTKVRKYTSAQSQRSGAWRGASAEWGWAVEGLGGEGSEHAGASLLAAQYRGVHRSVRLAAGFSTSETKDSSVLASGRPFGKFVIPRRRERREASLRSFPLLAFAMSRRFYDEQG